MPQRCFIVTGSKRNALSWFSVGVLTVQSISAKHAVSATEWLRRMAEKKVVKPEAMILFIAISPVRPESIDALVSRRASVHPFARSEANALRGKG